MPMLSLSILEDRETVMAPSAPPLGELLILAEPCSCQVLARYAFGPLVYPLTTVQGQGHQKNGASLHLALDRDPASVLTYDLIADREAEARPRSHALRREH